MRILLLDIETCPNLAYVWGKFEQDVIDYQSEWHILSFCCKWLGGKTIVKALPDYPLYKKNKENDRELAQELWTYLNEADVVIGHNLAEFDTKKANTRFIEHGLLPPSGYQMVDTLKVAQKYFAFNSNKLDDLGKRLNVGRKVKHSGFELWLGCIKGDPVAWKKMKKYNRGDVLLLERIYLRLLPWIENPPNLSFSEKCPKCQVGTLQKRGFGLTRTGRYQRLQCQNCGSWSRNQHEKLTNIR